MRRIITVEEHFDFPDSQTIPEQTEPENDAHVNPKGNDPALVTTLLANFDQKLAYMDQYGISLQVLSDPNAVASTITDKQKAVASAQRTNDHLAQKIAQYPGRFAGLAVLPLIDPEAAAEELHRSVTELGFKGALIGGVPFGHFLDEPQYLPIFEAAEKLEVPIYLHPGMPSKAQRELLYESPSYSDSLAGMLGSAGWGWHAEQGVQMIRLIAAGIFDRFPNLHLVSGHWGEMVPNFLERLDEFIGKIPTPLERKFSDYYRQNVFVTASGMFTKPQMQLAVTEMGADHVLWAEDFPFLRRKQQVTDFLEAADLTDKQKDQIAFQNSQKLFGLAK
ncbi:amidohydrolase family protein [Secundilactobacillus folii]|uniref:Amidohydrolase family protein n=1 Tax=Secundilactobacillus folii TaxID=2678357 RepID=A0A7X2XV22_9LACO|nr:amidohydrolase family protein [Secundilactobacillus folii]MTV81478.1 amidohydrolase family protein [Secundilactobacillus folii]